MGKRLAMFLVVVQSVTMAAQESVPANQARLSWSVSGAVDSFSLHAGPLTNFYTEVIEIPGAERDYVYVAGFPGTRFFALSATDDEGTSELSNEVAKTLSLQVIIEQEEVVYTVVKQVNRFVLLPVGTVPIGTMCDLENTVNGLGAVPTEDVVWTSPTGSRPIVVVAQCTAD